MTTGWAVVASLQPWDFARDDARLFRHAKYGLAPRYHGSACHFLFARWGQAGPGFITRPVADGLLRQTRHAVLDFQSRLATLRNAEASLHSDSLNETLDAARAAIAKRDAQLRRREKNTKASKKAVYAPPWNSFPSPLDAVARCTAVANYMLGAELLTESGVQELTEATLRKALVQFQHLPRREADVEEQLYRLLANSQHVE